MDEEQHAEIIEHLHAPRDSVRHPSRHSRYAAERIEWQLNQIRQAVVVVALIMSLGVLGSFVIALSSGS